MFHLLTCSVSSTKLKQKSKGVGPFFSRAKPKSKSLHFFLCRNALRFFQPFIVNCGEKKHFAAYLNGDASIVKHRFIWCNQSLVGLVGFRFRSALSRNVHTPRHREREENRERNFRTENISDEKRVKIPTIQILWMRSLCFVPNPKHIDDVTFISKMGPER